MSILKLFFLICFCILSDFVHAVQLDETQGEVTVEYFHSDSTKRIFEYWKEGYYNNITIADSLHKPARVEFDTILNKYQSKDFVYIESISDKLTFFSKLKTWIYNFLSDLFPDRCRLRNLGLQQETL